MKCFRGGKVVGEGGQGCVISPSWGKNGSKGSDTFVTKISTKYTTEKESNISKELKKLDPGHLYGIYALDDPVCGKITTEMWAREHIPTNGRCAALENRNQEDICYVRYSKYVSDLDSNLHKDMTSDDIVYSVVHLWKALAFMHTNNIIHGDIKAGNIAIIKHNDKKLFVFADWGWSAIINTKLEAKNAWTEMSHVAQEYLPRYYNASTNGIWSPKVFSAKTKNYASLLKFNDVFSLAYELRDRLKNLIHDKRLVMNEKTQKMIALFTEIFETQPLTMTASQVLAKIE